MLRRKFVFSALSSPSPYSQCLANYGLAWPQICRILPPSLLTHLPLPFPSLEKTQRYTDISFLKFYFNHENMRTFCLHKGLRFLVGTGKYLKWETPTCFLHRSLVDFHSFFYSPCNKRLLCLISSLFGACLHSAEGLILSSPGCSASGRETREPKRTLVLAKRMESNRKGDFKRTGLDLRGVLCQARAG